MSRRFLSRRNGSGATVGLSTGLVAVLCAVVAASPAQAAPLVWNTCEGGSDNVCNISASLNLPESPRTGNSNGYVFDAIGDPTRKLGARAFRTPDNFGSGDPAPTPITIFNGGLGAGDESAPQHAVDNVGPDEFIVFTLPSDTSRPLGFRIGWLDQDSDISTWIGGTLGGPNDALALLGGTSSWNQGALLTSLGYVRQDFLDVPLGTLQSFSNNAVGRYLIIGTRHEVDCGLRCNDGGEDKVKILQITADASVPAPATLVLLVAGATVAALRRRR
jgi:hypothetical protein